MIFEIFITVCTSILALILLIEFLFEAHYFAAFIVAAIFTLLMFAVWAKPKPVRHNGFIVCKEYTPRHMDNQTPRVIQEAYIFVPPAPHHVPQPVASSWIVYFANKEGVTKVSVDSLKYLGLRVGQRWQITQ